MAESAGKKVKQQQDSEWQATERSDDAEEMLVREYHYHLLRAQELSRFLRGCGCPLETTEKDDRPFYWSAGSVSRKFDSWPHAPSGWYQWTDRGLIYLGESILEREEKLHD